VQQVFVELYKYNDAWRATTPAERAGFVRNVSGSLSQLTRGGVEVIAFAVNDPGTDRRAPYDFFCVYLVPDRDAQREFERGIEESGWYRYFDQVNLSGAAMTPLAVLMANAALAEPTAQPEPIPAAPRFTKRFARAHERTMAYLDEGHGRSVVFLHGDAMSSYLWRNVLPHVEGRGRLVAVDLIGAGDSDKLPGSGPGSYGFAEHAHYLGALLDSLELGDEVVLVGHDWGANLAVDWAMKNSDRVSGIVFGEALMPPFEWFDWPAEVRPEFEYLRTAEGERAVLEENYFVNNVQQAVLRRLSAAELAEIARPYADPGEGRRPTITWPRSVPFGDDRTPTRELLERQAEWMATNPVPKLHFRGVPGALATGRRAAAISKWSNLTEVAVTGLHWTPEDDPHGIGSAVNTWIKEIRG
jgi:haloalkane dehalogenase